ncbi:MAG: IS630 family transposase [Bacteroidales bacterium]|nr:IS630 family transposase [Bacteroidales bacterium]
MQKLSIPNITVEELENILNSNPDYVVGSRIMALIQIKKGLSSRKLEGLYYKSHSRFCVWVKNFNKDGVEGLRDKPRSGRKPKLDLAQQEALKCVLTNNRPDEFGFNSATWSGPLIGEYIKKTFGVEYKRAQVYNILKALGFSFQKARGRYPEADPIQQAAFVESLKKTAGRTP